MTTTEETDMSEVHPYQPSEGACETGARHSFLWFLLRPPSFVTSFLNYSSHPSRLIRPKAGPCGTEMRRGKDGKEKGSVATRGDHFGHSSFTRFPCRYTLVSLVQRSPYSLRTRRRRERRPKEGALRDRVGSRRKDDGGRHE